LLTLTPKLPVYTPTMWSDRLYIWSVFDGTLLSLPRQPVTGLLQYSAVELLRLRFHLPDPPPTALHLHLDIAFLEIHPPGVPPELPSGLLKTNQVHLVQLPSLST